MAGVLAARVLAEHFDRVTIVERDERSSNVGHRRGVPQGRHAHVLLLAGQRTIFDLFPDARHALIQAGATHIVAHLVDDFSNEPRLPSTTTAR